MFAHLAKRQTWQLLNLSARQLSVFCSFSLPKGSREFLGTALLTLRGNAHMLAVAFSCMMNHFAQNNGNSVEVNIPITEAIMTPNSLKMGNLLSLWQCVQNMFCIKHDTIQQCVELSRNVSLSPAIKRKQFTFEKQVSCFFCILKQYQLSRKLCRQLPNSEVIWVNSGLRNKCEHSQGDSGSREKISG